MNVWEKGRFVFNSTLSSAGKFHGLFNQGATCYLNSVLQVLFMTKDFREAVARPPAENTDPDCIDQHLTRLFDDLKQQTARTHEIRRKLGINRVNEQRDAAEYYEKILSLTSPEASKIFHGELTHRTVCSTCRAETGADGLFWLLPLTLVDSTNRRHYKVVDGIEEFFRSSSFSGENQMYCDNCDDKSDATTECVIKHHPEVLVLLLKRFEFNYHYMEYFKVSCAVDVPSTLQIPENQTYELYAVVDHFGDLRGGHYDAKIKSEDDQRWYQFNDTTVSELGDQEEFEQSCSAYLLFYRKKDGRPAAKCTQHIIGEESPPEDAQRTISDQRQDVEEEEGEAEEAADEGDDTAAELSPDPCFNVEDQVSGVSARHRIHYDNRERNEEGFGPPLPHEDVHGEKLRDEVEIRMEDEEDMGGNVEPEKTENLFREPRLEESVEEGDDGAGSGDISWRRPEEGDVIHNTSFNDQKDNRDERHVHLQQVNMQIDEERDSVKGVNEDVGDTQAAGRDFSPVFVSVDEQKGEERTQIRHEAEKKDGDSGWCKRYEQQRKETTDVYRVKEQKRGDDKSAKLIETSITKPSFNEYVKDQDERRHLVIVPHTRHIDANVRQTERENKREERTLNRVDSGGGQRDCQPEFNEKTVEGRRGSNKSRKIQVKVIEEEVKNTQSGTQISSETTDIIIEIPEGSCQDGTERKSGAKRNLKHSLSVGFQKLKLNEKKEPKKGASKRVREVSPEETETNSKKKGRWSVPALPSPHGKKTARKQKAKQKEPKKNTGCFPFNLKKWKK